MTRDELEGWCRDEGLELSAEAWARLDRLMSLWRRYGRALNLVGSTEPEVLYEHVREALLGVRLVERLAEGEERILWLDIGSGGGLPGLVVAAARDWEVILVEPRERRAAFLELGMGMLGGRTGRVIRGRWPLSTWSRKLLGDVESRMESSYSVLSSRAVFSADRWVLEALEGVISRGIVLCHVEIGVEEVAGKKPTGVQRGGRWSVLGFSVGSGAE